MPPSVVDAVLEQVRTAEGREGGALHVPPRSQAAGVVFRYESPANLAEGEAVIMIVARDMAVAQTVRCAVPGSPAALGRGSAKELLEAAALRLAEIDLVAKEVLGAGIPQADDSGLTESEEKELRRGGFDPEPQRNPATDPVAHARAEYASLVVGALTVKQAAKLLGVNDSRIRQRLADRTLYGIKEGVTWRIPRFQFQGKRVVPGLDAVLPTIRGDVHPVALRRWLTTASPDLPLGADETTVSPLDWLASGGDPAPVVALAEAL